jgi:hypothetical protein
MYYAIAGIINSSTFDCLSRLERGELQGGYSQLNKQYLSAIPFPYKKLKKNLDLTKSIAAVVCEIIKVNEEIAGSKGMAGFEAVESLLSEHWRNLDDLIAKDVYELTPDEFDVVKKHPREVDRVKSVVEAS